MRMKQWMRWGYALIIFYGQISSTYANNNDDLLDATRNGNLDAVTQLLQQGADPNFRDAQGYNAFDYSIERRQYDISLHLLTTELWRYATSENARRNVTVLLNDTLVSTPIELKALSTEIRIVLLKIAASRGHAAQVRALLASGLHPDVGIETAYSALALAVRWNRTEVVDLLLKAGADANGHTHSCYQSTPLMEATRDGLVSLSEHLIVAGARVNEPDRYGDHALNWAVYFGHLSLVKLLLAKGADLTRTGQTDDQPLDIAIREGHHEIVKVLQAAGATLRPDKNTPLN